MSGKKDSFDINELSVNNSGIIEKKPKKAAQTPKKQPIKNKAKPGKKPKAPELLATKKVLMSFTEEQAESLKEKAGLVPLATWIKARLIENGDI